jgi:carnitine monooxygenase subunit
MHENHADRRRRVAREIRRRLVAHIAAGGTTDFAAAPMVNSPAVYGDPARALVEVRRLFQEMPVLVGLSADVAGPGDVLLHEDAGPSVIVTRGRDGRVRAFRNMCTHRGSMLVRADEEGRCERRARFTCPFHAWTFDLEGRLVGLPGRAGFEGGDLEARHLTPVRVAEWHGLVFVQLDGLDGPVDVDAHLGSFAPELAQLELERATPITSSALSSACNWKLALDTYAEGYHFATLHASTIGTSHFSNVAAFDAFGRHWRLNFAEKTLRGLAGTPEDEWPDTEYGGIHFLFPNTVLVVGAVAPGQIFVRMFRLFPERHPGP